MTAQPYDWQTDEPPAPLVNRALEDSLLAVLERWTMKQKPPPNPKNLRALAAELAAVARPHALAELLHRLAEEAKR